MKKDHLVELPDHWRQFHKRLVRRIFEFLCDIIELAIQRLKAVNHQEPMARNRLQQCTGTLMWDRRHHEHPVLPLDLRQDSLENIDIPVMKIHVQMYIPSQLRPKAPVEL